MKFNIENSTIQQSGGTWIIHDAYGRIHTFKDHKELDEMLQRHVDRLIEIQNKVRLASADGRQLIIKPFKVKDVL